MFDVALYNICMMDVDIIHFCDIIKQMILCVMIALVYIRIHLLKEIFIK